MHWKNEQHYKINLEKEKHLEIGDTVNRQIISRLQNLGKKHEKFRDSENLEIGGNRSTRTIDYSYI